MNCFSLFRNVLTSREVADFVSERLEKQSDSNTMSLSKVSEEVMGLGLLMSAADEID